MSAIPLRYDPLPPGRNFLDLEDGPRRRAWWMRTGLDCERASVATVLGVDYDELPKGVPAEYVSWHELMNAQERLSEWAHGRGLRIRYWGGHDPAAHAGYWVGIADEHGPPAPGKAKAPGHAVVMHGLTLVHDPALAWPVPPGKQVLRVRSIDYGMTFEPMGGDECR